MEDFIIWVSKQPPIYVFGSDLWRNELNNRTYYPDMVKRVWKACDDGEIIPWPKKAKEMKINMGCRR